LYNKKNGFAREKYDKFGFLLFYFVKFLLDSVLGINKFAKVSIDIDSKTYITRWTGNQENERNLRKLQSGM